MVVIVYIFCSLVSLLHQFSLVVLPSSFAQFVLSYLNHHQTEKNIMKMHATTPSFVVYDDEVATHITFSPSLYALQQHVSHRIVVFLTRNRLVCFEFFLPLQDLKGKANRTNAAQSAREGRKTGILHGRDLLRVRK